MIRNQLKLNDDKTEFLLIRTKKQLGKVSFSSITVGDTPNMKLGDLCHGLTFILTFLSTLVSLARQSFTMHLHITYRRSYLEVFKARV